MPDPSETLHVSEGSDSEAIEIHPLDFIQAELERLVSTVNVGSNQQPSYRCSVCQRNLDTLADSLPDFLGNIVCPDCTRECIICRRRYNPRESTLNGLCLRCSDRPIWRHPGPPVPLESSTNELDWNGLLPRPISVGIELEAEGGNPAILNKALHKLAQIRNPTVDYGLVRDGSLNETGVELITPAAYGKKAKQSIITSCKLLRVAGYKVSSRCGTHIHLGMPECIDNPEDLRQLMMGLMVMEPFIYSLLPAHRKWGRHSQPLGQHWSVREVRKDLDIDQILYKMDIPNRHERIAPVDEHIQAAKDSKYMNARYHGFNLHAVYFHGTLESRHLEGTLNEDLIFSWIAIVARVVEAAKNISIKFAAKVAKSPQPEQVLAGEELLSPLPESLMSFIKDRQSKYYNNEDSEVLINY